MITQGNDYDFKCRDLGEDGEGIGSIEENYTCFVEGILPGESGRIKLVQKKKKYGTGKLLELTAVSPDRTEPACPHFSDCGGCQLMQLQYSEQLRLKQKKVSDAIRRIAGIETVVDDIIPSDPETRYRNKSVYPVSGSSDKPRFGFYKKKSHDVTDIPDCLVSPEKNRKIGDTVRSHINSEKIPLYVERINKGFFHRVIIRHSLTDGKYMVILVVSSNNPAPVEALVEDLKHDPEIISIYLNVKHESSNLILGEESVLLHGEKYIRETISGLDFHISPMSFFQVNTLQAEKLYSQVRESAAGGKQLLDLYCGTGTLALLLAGKYDKVCGVEIDKSAIDDAKFNAATNKIKNSEFIHKDSLAYTRKLKKDTRPDTVILNPPRKGVDAQLISEIGRLKVPQLIYVSCKPSTLARDLKLLSAEGYKVENITPFDMFPQTVHVETVVSLRSS